MGLFSSKPAAPTRYIPTDNEYNDLSNKLDSNDNLWDSLKIISYIMGIDYINCRHDKYNNCEECNNLRLVKLPVNFELYVLFAFNIYKDDDIIYIASNTNNLDHLIKLKPCVEKMSRYVKNPALSEFSNGRVYISLFEEYLDLYNKYIADLDNN